MVSSRASITQEQVYGLFDLIPGMDYCEMQRDPYGFNKGNVLCKLVNLSILGVICVLCFAICVLTCTSCVLHFLGQAMIRYNNLGSAVYAKEKLNGFEYPPGNRLVVAYVDDGEDRSRYGNYG